MDVSLKVDEQYRSALTYSEAVARFKTDLRRAWPNWRFHSYEMKRDQQTQEWKGRAYANTYNPTPSDDE
jgi:hypothetical protein